MGQDQSSNKHKLENLNIDSFISESRNFILMSPQKFEETVLCIDIIVSTNFQDIRNKMMNFNENAIMLNDNDHIEIQQEDIIYRLLLDTSNLVNFHMTRELKQRLYFKILDIYEVLLPSVFFLKLFFQNSAEQISSDLLRNVKETTYLKRMSKLDNIKYYSKHA